MGNKNDGLEGRSNTAKPKSAKSLSAVPSKPDECVEYAGVSRQGYHQFTIPVEWAYDTDTYGTSHGEIPVAVGKQVTKLRCVCGAETERRISWQE